MKKIVLLMMIVAICGCGSNESEKEVTKEVTSEPTSTPFQDSGNEVVSQLSKESDGGYFAEWPAWCSAKKIRVLASEHSSNTAVVSTECKRSDTEGIIVFSYFELANGSDVMTAEHVLENVIIMVENQNLVIQKQTPIMRNGMEGIQLLCTGDNEKRKWIEGFLSFDRMLIISAWRSDNTLFSDPDISRMFKSVQMLK
ncbi:hypothetical protein HN388_05690 [bacterium]|jgi:hypothetical protein|nr:hypothetical protein [bacterium]MBT4291235.1 hypothetical protein [bacterium]MBT7310981.1 hypothetical protein [bacterium]